MAVLFHCPHPTKPDWTWIDQVSTVLDAKPRWRSNVCHIRSTSCHLHGRALALLCIIYHAPPNTEEYMRRSERLSHVTAKCGCGTRQELFIRRTETTTEEQTSRLLFSDFIASVRSLTPRYTTNLVVRCVGMFSEDVSMQCVCKRLQALSDMCRRVDMTPRSPPPHHPPVTTTARASLSMSLDKDMRYIDVIATKASRRGVPCLQQALALLCTVLDASIVANDNSFQLRASESHAPVLKRNLHILAGMLHAAYWHTSVSVCVSAPNRSAGSLSF
jgi:hypothetical protein